MSDDIEKRPESSPEDIQNVLHGGVTMGRWKEGLLFKGIAPNSWAEVGAASERSGSMPLTR